MRKFTTITVELYAFIFDRPYRSRILSPILCTLDYSLYVTFSYSYTAVFEVLASANNNKSQIIFYVVHHDWLFIS